MESIIDELGEPTKETELLRLWKTNKTDKLKDEKGFEIDLGEGNMVNMMGFTEFTNKKTKELMFAYKFKHEEKFILYYIPKETEDTKNFSMILKKIAEVSGYNLQDLKENLKSIKEEFKLERKK